MSTSDLNLLLFCSDKIPLGKEYYTKLKSFFSTVIIVSLGQRACPYTKADISIDAISQKAQALNEAMALCREGHAFYLEANETFLFDDLRSFLPEPDHLYPVAITIGDAQHVHFQLRIFPTKRGLSFSGSSIPVLSPSVHTSDSQISELFLPVQKASVLYEGIAIEEQLTSHPAIGEFWLMNGLQLAAKSKYKEAEKNFKQAVQKTHMSIFDLAAAYNGLADAYFEQNKWEECKEAAHKSIALEKRQRMPYLLLFRACFANGEWEEAYSNLYAYLEHLASGSLVNYDIIFPVAQTHYLLADTAYKQGWHERAFVHYEQYFELKEGQVMPEILERLILYSLELGEEENASNYFHKMFWDKIPKELSEHERTKMMEILSIFSEKEWYQTPLKTLEVLFEEEPNNAEILRKWVATLIKAREIEKAQELMKKHKTTFS